jgi:hypothetical protein
VRAGWDEETANHGPSLGDTMFLRSKCPCMREERPRNCVCVTCEEMKCYLQALERERAKGKPQVSLKPPQANEEIKDELKKFERLGLDADCGRLREALDDGPSLSNEEWSQMRDRVLLRPGGGCDHSLGDACAHCRTLAAPDWTQQTPGYWTFEREGGKMARLATLCEKSRLPQLDVPDSDEEAFRTVSLYSPNCCVGAPDFTPCDLCGFERLIGGFCPSEACAERMVLLDVYEETAVGKERVKENGEVGQRSQTARVQISISMKELWCRLRDDWPGYVAHYWLFKFIDFIFKVILLCFGSNVLLLQADFAAQVGLYL